MRNNKKSFRLLIVAMLIALVGAATYAFTASNTVPGSKAGSGSGAISGYTVSNIQYTLGANPTNLNAVSFNLDAAASDVKITLVNGGTVYDCGAAGAGPSFAVSCDTTVGTQATVSPANNLTVVSVS
jgi:hypothetical protein